MQNVSRWENCEAATYHSFLNDKYTRKFSDISPKFYWSRRAVSERKFALGKYLPDLDSIKSAVIPLPDLKLLPSLYSVKVQAQTKVYPNYSSTTPCTIMLMTNLASPEWISISCTEKMLINVVCMSQQSAKFSPNKVNDDSIASGRHCPYKFIFYRKLCYFFIWYDYQSTKQQESYGFPLQEECEKVELKSFDHNDPQFFSFLYEAISAHFPSVLYQQFLHNKPVRKYIFDQVLNTNTFQSQYVTHLFNASGLHSCFANRQLVSLGLNILSCSGGSHVTSMSVCDKHSDCPGEDISDESVCDNNSSNSSCPHSFHMSVKGECLLYLSFTNMDSRETTFNKTYFLCGNKTRVDSTLLNDLVVDCVEHEDEPHLTDLIFLHNYHSCEISGQVPCKDGHSKCFDLHDVCLYKLNKHNYMTPCRTGGHLVKCADFECNVDFKCPNYYCIPWRYVCDKKWDCPSGSDEQYAEVCFPNSKCRHLFKCTKTHTKCIHPGNVCDSYSDCSHHDDEELCELHAVKCPDQCLCLAFSIVCQEMLLSSFLDDKHSLPFVSVSVFNTKFSFAKAFLLKLTNPYFILLINTTIQSFHSSFLQHKEFLLLLNFTQNQLASVDENMFSMLPVLKVLILDQNCLTNIHSESFKLLKNLSVLSVSQNPLKTFDMNTLSRILNLVLFAIRNVSLNEITTAPLFRMRVIVATDFHICCAHEMVTNCQSERPWCRTCSGMLTKAQFPGFLTVSFCILLVNTVSMSAHFYDKRKDKKKRSFCTIVISMNVADLLMSLYLIIVWATNLYFGQEFMVKEHIWRSSPLCFALFSLLFASLLSSPCLHLLLAIARLVIVLHPLNTKFKTVGFCLLCIQFLSLACLLPAITISTLVGLFLFKLPSNLCLPHVDPSHSFLTITTITWVILMTHLVFVICIMILHIVLYVNLRESQKKISNAKNKSASNRGLLAQLVLLSVSNCSGWIFPNVVFVTLLFVPQYPLDIVAWNVAFGVPLSSFVTPAVLTVVCARNILCS